MGKQSYLKHVCLACALGMMCLMGLLYQWEIGRLRVEDVASPSATSHEKTNEFDVQSEFEASKSSGHNDASKNYSGQTDSVSGVQTDVNSKYKASVAPKIDDISTTSINHVSEPQAPRPHKDARAKTSGPSSKKVQMPSLPLSSEFGARFVSCPA
eukprot:TRINITY_DN35618_c0_g1_i1.p1 TRINITY_DN35618_c0_g1~~TRINITY_DN35618_c0_g1_i1.p1  ORF type:complete len:155 (-),score=3.07 TRINITY_DN35618_c0_g1_i1:461-925(-)